MQNQNTESIDFQEKTNPLAELWKQSKGEVKDRFAEFEETARNASFQDRYKYLDIGANVVSYVSNFIVIAVCFFIVSSYIVGFLVTLLGFDAANVVGNTISIALLLLVEQVKRKSANEYFTRLFLSGFRNKINLNVIVLFLLTLLSLGLSQGGHNAADLLTGEAQVFTAEKTDVEAIKNDYNKQISGASQQAENFKSSRSYLGKLSLEDAKRYSKLLKEVQELRSDKTAAVNKANADNKAATEKAATDTENAKIERDTKVKTKGKNIQYATIFFDLLLAGCFMFRGFYTASVIAERRLAKSK